MDWVKLRTHVIDHARFLAAGAVARDLYTWGLLYAGEHETDGELPMVAVMTCPWGKGGKSNVVVANKLVDVGLWERTDSGYRVLRWAEQGNQTKAQILSEREAARERMAKRRPPKSDPPSASSESACSPEHRPNFGRSSPDVPTSTSYSLSGSDLGSDPRGGSQNESQGPPPWWSGVCDTVEANTGARLERGKAWLRYSGHRRANGKAMSPPDAQQFLVSVDVREHQQDRARDQARRDRFEPPPKPRVSKEQELADAKAFAAELAARRKVPA